MSTKIKMERVYYSLLCLYINILPIMDLISDIYVLIGARFDNKSMVQNILYAMLIPLLLVLNGNFALNKLIRLLLALILSICVFGISVLATPDIKPMIIHTYITFCILVVFTVFFICQIENFGMFLHYIEGYYLLLMIYSLTVLLVKKKLPHGYSMSFSYNTFFIAGIALLMGLKNKSLYRLVIFTVVLFTNLIAGARGALLCDLILFLLVLIVLLYNTADIKKILRTIMILATGFAGVLIVPILAQNLYEKYPSRTLELLANRRITVLSGRQIFYESLSNTILQEPIRFRGVLADRVFMAGISGISINGDNMTTYAHNFFLELFFQFGLLFGCIILMFVLIKMGKSLIWIIRNNSMDIYFTIVFLVSFSYAVGQLMFSGSYLICSSTGYLIASLIMSRRLENLMNIQVVIDA